MLLVVKLKSSLNKNVTTARVTSDKVEVIIKPFLVHSILKTYHVICNMSNITGATFGAEITYNKDHVVSSPVFCGVCVYCLQ